MYLQLGVNNGLGRERLLFRQGNRRKGSTSLLATAQTWLVSMGVLVGCGFVAAAGWFSLHHRWQLALGCAAYVPIAVAFFYSTLYLQSTYRTAHDFAPAVACHELAERDRLGVGGRGLWFGFHGLCVRAAITILVGTALLHWWRPIRVRWQWNAVDFRHLLAIGFPIFFVGELGSRLWMLIDTTLVGSSLNMGGLGLYGIVVRAQTPCSSCRWRLAASCIRE